MAMPKMQQDRPPEESAGAGGPVLRLSGLTKSYGPTRAIDGMSFAVAAGDIVGLIGANGAGKSTLMRILAGVTMPDAGGLEIGGKTIDLQACGSCIRSSRSAAA
jgi:ribose transport system ATP-binding protein